MNKPTQKLILLASCAIFSNFAFAANTYYAFRAVEFFALGIPILILTSCLGSWIVGKGNRMMYNLSTPLIYVGLFFTILGFWRDIPSSLYYTILFIGLIVYAIIIKKLGITKKETEAEEKAQRINLEEDKWRIEKQQIRAKLSKLKQQAKEV